MLSSFSLPCSRIPELPTLSSYNFIFSINLFSNHPFPVPGATTTFFLTSVRLASFQTPRLSEVMHFVFLSALGQMTSSSTHVTTYNKISPFYVAFVHLQHFSYLFFSCWKVGLFPSFLRVVLQRAQEFRWSQLCFCSPALIRLKSRLVGSYANSICTF